MSHTSSRTWVSLQTQERELFVQFMNNRKDIAPKCPFLPDTFEKWIEHRLETKIDEQKWIQDQICAREAYARRESREKVMPALDGKRFPRNLGAVVAWETVFVPWYKGTPDRIEPPWPSSEEFKHEGDDREKSKYRRQLPLARRPGNVTVNWKQRQMQDPFPFDSTVDRRSPQMLHEVQLQDFLASLCLGKSLLEAINH